MREQGEVDIRLAELPTEPDGTESELDETWGYVGKKDNPRWLWQDKRPQERTRFSLHIWQT